MENKTKRKLTNLGFALGVGSMPGIAYAYKTRPQVMEPLVNEFHQKITELAAEEHQQTQKNILEAYEKMSKGEYPHGVSLSRKIDAFLQYLKNIKNPPAELVYEKYPTSNLAKETRAFIIRKPLSPAEIENLKQKFKAQMVRRINLKEKPKFIQLYLDQVWDTVLSRTLSMAGNRPFAFASHKIVSYPPNTSSAALAHELGHIKDCRTNPHRFNDLFRLDELYKPIKKTKRYLREVRAWDLGGVPATEPIRELALRSYAIGFGNRRILGWGIPLAAGTYGLASLFNRKPNAKNNLNHQLI